MNVTHLECAACGTRHEARRLHNLCTECAKPLLVRYDLKCAAASLTKQSLQARRPDLWRYRELLPVRRPENVVSLGEVVTPLVALPRIAGRLAPKGQKPGEILVKDEGRLPTGSFKARGLVLAVRLERGGSGPSPHELLEGVGGDR